MFQVRSWPTVILHLDGDSFFASVIQAVNPQYKNKPLVTGRERGIATAISYQAKKYGIKRGMGYFEIKKLCPDCLMIDSDYETYDIFSQRLFAIMRSVVGDVEEYSVDEGFADIKGLRRPLNLSYFQIGKKIKDEVEKNLGLTVSVGISLTKSLAKLASSWQKPAGLTLIDGLEIEKFLSRIAVKEIWGIGENTSAYLNKFGIKTALDFALKPEEFIKAKLSKPFFEIWKELHGHQVFNVDTTGKTNYKSMSRTGTFAPPTNDKQLLWAKLLNHVENVFIKARSYKYQVGKIAIFLKTQSFSFRTTEVKLIPKTAYPALIKKELRAGFEKIYRQNFLYRTTGATIYDFEENVLSQPTLFSDTKFEEKIKKIYPLYETKKIDFGTCLFDKKITKEKPEKQKFKIPVLSLTS